MLEWIRGEQKFESLDELMAAMKGDENFCRARMG
jgi:FAD synthase